MPENLNLQDVLDRFVNSLKDALIASDDYPHNVFETQADSQWPSPCITTIENTQGQVAWLPVLQQQVVSFTDLEHAVNVTLHDDIKIYYSRYYSDPLNATSARGQLQLLQVWNDEDFERLQANLIGHILMKQKLKQPITLFFALTDEEDFILSIDNDSGEVLLEQVGLPAKEVIAPDLATFIQSIQPLI